MRWTAVLCAVLSMSAAASGQGPGEDESSSRFGLFIGINSYPHLKERHQLAGCVRDAEQMRRVWVQQFGFQAPPALIDDNATRDGIVAALRALIDRVSEADGPATVVIFYAGHGGRLPDSEASGSGLDEADGVDETWLPHDATLGGKNHILDDDIDVVIGALSAQGAQVILLSDSCHSGTIHRGESTGAIRHVICDPDAAAPVGPLFPELRARDSAADGRDPGAPGDIGALPGFVSYSACTSTQYAYEHLEDDENWCGRFSYAFRSVIPSIGVHTTYGDLHRLIVSSFEELGFSDQTPRFHASHAKRTERFLGGGVVDPHASVVPGSAGATSVVVDWGSIDGVAEGTTFRFFATSGDMMSGGEPLATGVARNVTGLSTVVTLPAGTSVPDTAVASADLVRMNEVVIDAAAHSVEGLEDALEALAADGKIVLAVEGGASPTLILDDVPGADMIGLYLPTARPRGEVDEALQPSPIWSAPRDIGVSELADQIARRSQTQRFMSLSANGGLLDVQLIGMDGEPLASSGALDLAPGEPFLIKITNRARTGLFVRVFMEDLLADPPIALVFPDPVYGDADDALAPGQSITLPAEGNFTAEIKAWEQPMFERDERVRTRVKFIGVSQPRSFQHLLQSPQAGTRGSDFAQDDDPFERMLANTLHGGDVLTPLTRSISRRTGLTWATSMVVFDVVKDER